MTKTSLRAMQARLLGHGAALALFAATPALWPVPAHAWELETHVGLTQRAVQRSALEAALHGRGLDAGLHEILGLRASPQPAGTPLDDADLLLQLALLDPALGASPDGARAPALTWLLAGTALEGSRIERLRHHYVDPRRGGGLDEREGYLGQHQRFVELARGDGSRTPAFDGTGLRADRWADAPRAQNPLSRARLLDELYLAASAASPAERGAATARALLCTGALVHVLESVGAPANAHGDFVVNYLTADRPLERWAQARYGLLPPTPTTLIPPRRRLAAFFTAPDGSGLADEVARTYTSPGTLPPRGLPLAQGRLAAAADALLPRIAAESAALLDFLFRGALSLVRSSDSDGAHLEIRVGGLALGVGEIALFIENEAGARQRVLARPTRGGAVDQPLITLGAVELDSSAIAGAHRLIAVYRGVDDAGEPLVLSQIAAR